MNYELISHNLTLPQRGVQAVLQLLDEGCTIPFIARYRKERTGSLDEVQIANIKAEATRLADIDKRRDTILATIQAQGKLTPQLENQLRQCWDANKLEDLYQPYKPRRRTRAQIAREHGLEPLAQRLMQQRPDNAEALARPYVKGGVKDTTAALAGAQDIIAEQVSDNAQSRQQVRAVYLRTAVITSKVVKARQHEPQAQHYKDYFQFSEPLSRIPAHRLLALRRGEGEGILRVTITGDDEGALQRLQRYYVRGQGATSQLVADAVADGYKRLLRPGIETEFAALSKQRADREAIHVFATNLRQLLLAAPLGQQRVMGVDPGFRTGCKVVCLDAQGQLLHHAAIFPHPPVGKTEQAGRQVLQLIERYQVQAIAVGNGTASRETVQFLQSLALPSAVAIHVVSEDGASVYSASAVAREEFPNEDVTVRGAVSIARRLVDPLAELVKIDPKSIGVGQYQHDVDQGQLQQSLRQTVESCVNSVGVNINTASPHLLTHVSGLGPALAQNIVSWRTAHGPFSSRRQLLDVPRLGAAAFQQSAGFLRIPGAANPLDNTAVHPERYALVEHIARQQGCTVQQLIQQPSLRQQVSLERYVTADAGLPTLTDIMRELSQPGRDPRGHVEAFAFSPDVHTIDDVRPGQELPGIVTNITQFGAFVDIGVHHDGLVHVSHLADRYVSDPNDAVRLHQHVIVRVLDVDLQRHRISLSMKDVVK